ncbi:MAG TPA: hypothetical protein VM221_03660 [Armatimonadota bacterium]|nr:hypothetical protein [Armatimonadota bacterium]
MSPWNAFCVARTAAGRLVHRPGLALAVVALASVAFVSNAFFNDAASPRHHPRSDDRRPPFAQRWHALYRAPGLHALVWQPLAGFTEPAYPLTHIADGWSAFIGRRQAPNSSFDPTRMLAARAILLSLVTALVLAWLLGAITVKDDSSRKAAGAAQRLRAHYLPILLVVLVPAAWQFMMGAIIFGRGPAPGVNLLRWLAHHVGRDGALSVWYASAMIPFVLLMLAPFAIVAQNTGAWRGISQGLRLLGRNVLALIGLFVIAWGGYQALLLCDAAASLPAPLVSWFIMLSLPGLTIFWSWVHWVGMALLGLWVAYAFMEITRGPAEAPHPSEA